MSDNIPSTSIASGGDRVQIHIQSTASSTQVHIATTPSRRQLTDHIASLLDPSSLDGRSMLHDTTTWDEPHLQRLVSAIQPSDLITINRKRQAARLEEPAKTLEWKNLTLVDSKGIKLLDDVSGVLNPGELVGILGGPGQLYTHIHTHIHIHIHISYT